MPTLVRMQLPPPKDWDEFQEIALSALRLRWRSPNLQQYGGSGQAQEGVDIFGPDDLGRPVGAQCKLRSDELDFKKDIVAEVTKADAFEPPLEAYFIVTTAKRDAKLQEQVRKLSMERLGRSKFPVGVIFWDDITVDLASDRREFEKHFPQLGHLLDTPLPSLGQRLLCALDTGHNGVAVKHVMNLIFGELGRMVQEEPRQFDAMLHELEGSIRPFRSDNEHADFTRLTRQLMAACDQADWSAADGLATKIEGIVNSVRYEMSGRLYRLFGSRCPRRRPYRAVPGRGDEPSAERVAPSHRHTRALRSRPSRRGHRDDEHLGCGHAGRNRVREVGRTTGAGASGSVLATIKGRS